MSDEATPKVVQCADDACEAIRLLNYHSSWNSLPADRELIQGLREHMSDTLQIP